MQQVVQFGAVDRVLPGEGGGDGLQVGGSHAEGRRAPRCADYGVETLMP